MQAVHVMFCQFCLCNSWFCDRAVTLQYCLVFVLFLACVSRFMLGRGVQIRALISSLVLVSCWGLDTCVPCFCLICERLGCEFFHSSCALVLCIWSAWFMFFLTRPSCFVVFCVAPGLFSSAMCFYIMLRVGHVTLKK